MILKNFPNVFPVPIFKVDLRHACLPLLAIGSKKRRSRRNKRVIATCLRYPNIPLLSLSNLLTRMYPTAPYPACCLPRSGRIRVRVRQGCNYFSQKNWISIFSSYLYIYNILLHVPSQHNNVRTCLLEVEVT